MSTFVSPNPRLLYTVHGLHAWVSPSPRVRCQLACFTYLLTTYSCPLPRPGLSTVRIPHIVAACMHTEMHFQSVVGMLSWELPSALAAPARMSFKLTMGLLNRPRARGTRHGVNVCVYRVACIPSLGY
jgi:hypothetical protein